MSRRAQTSTPPNPASDILANAMNSAIRLGGTGVGSSGPMIAAGGESGGMDADLERWPCRANLICAVPAPKPAARALFFSTFAPYIERAGSPAMEINCRRNKPFGPGGSTRRLHQNPNQSWLTGFGGGETGSTGGERAGFFPGYFRRYLVIQYFEK